jgi:uncharacterized protein YjgD (DUF1641 family)
MTKAELLELLKDDEIKDAVTNAVVASLSKDCSSSRILDQLLKMPFDSMAEISSKISKMKPGDVLSGK